MCVRESKLLEKWDLSVEYTPERRDDVQALDMASRRYQHWFHDAQGPFRTKIDAATSVRSTFYPRGVKQMPQGMFVQRIDFHRERANFFHQAAQRRHRRAAALARRSLAAQKHGRPVRARRLMEAALQVKAAAGRAGLRSRMHRARVGEIRQARARRRRQVVARR
jgi:hypothetical protein